MLPHQAWGWWGLLPCSFLLTPWLLVWFNPSYLAQGSTLAFSRLVAGHALWTPFFKKCQHFGIQGGGENHLTAPGPAQHTQEHLCFL